MATKDEDERAPRSGDVGKFKAQDKPRTQKQPSPKPSKERDEDGPREAPVRAAPEASGKLETDSLRAEARGSELPFLVPPAPGASYDPELDTLIRVAANAGLQKGTDSAINYTTLLIGFAYCDDAASRFLQGSALFKRGELLASRGLTIESNSEMRFVYLARKEGLPMTDTLYSPSARRMLALASEVAADVGSDGRIGTRHLLAAFLYRSPPDHLEDLQRWGLDSPGLAAAFFRFVDQHWQRESEGWRRFYRQAGLRLGEDGVPTEARAADHLRGSEAPQATGDLASARELGDGVNERLQAKDAPDAAVQRARYVAPFGADDPSLQPRDLLDVKDEARAFAS